MSDFSKRNRISDGGRGVANSSQSSLVLGSCSLQSPQSQSLSKPEVPLNGPLSRRELGRFLGLFQPEEATAEGIWDRLSLSSHSVDPFAQEPVTVISH